MRAGGRYLRVISGLRAEREEEDPPELMQGHLTPRSLTWDEGNLALTEIQKDSLMCVSDWAIARVGRQPQILTRNPPPCRKIDEPKTPFVSSGQLGETGGALPVAKIPARLAAHAIALAPQTCPTLSSRAGPAPLCPAADGTHRRPLAPGRACPRGVRSFAADSLTHPQTQPGRRTRRRQHAAQCAARRTRGRAYCLAHRPCRRRPLSARGPALPRSRSRGRNRRRPLPHALAIRLAQRVLFPPRRARWAHCPPAELGRRVARGRGRGRGHRRGLRERCRRGDYGSGECVRGVAPRIGSGADPQRPRHAALQKHREFKQRRKGHYSNEAEAMRMAQALIAKEADEDE